MSISFEEMKKAFATSNKSTEAADSVIELCYAKRRVMIKPLKVKDKKNLLKSIEGKRPEVVNKIIDNILEKYVEPVDGGDFDVMNLVAQDRQQIMVYIRVAAGGEEARILHQCPECEHINKNIPYNLNDIKIKNFDPNKVDNNVVLNNNFKVEIGPVTRKEEKEVEQFVRLEKLESETEKAFAMMAACIKDISIRTDDGAWVSTKLDGYEQLHEFFNDVLDTSHLQIITDRIKGNDFGVTLPMNFVCENCGFTANEEASVVSFFIS